MMSGNGTNPIFFNKKKIGRPEHSLTQHPPTSNNISFFLSPTPPTPPHPFEVDVICVSPLTYFLIRLKIL